MKTTYNYTPPVQANNYHGRLFFDTTFGSTRRPALLYNRRMDDLASLLANKNFEEPPESVAIKQYIYDTYQSDVQVQVREKDIVVIVQSAALASQLRFSTPRLQAAAATEKRIVLRINN